MSARVGRWGRRVVGAVLTLWLVACGETGLFVWRSEPAAAGVPSLSAWVLMLEEPDWQAEMLLRAGQPAGESGPPAITVSGFSVDSANYYQRIETAAARGEAPDIVFIENASQLLAWIAAGYVEPLDDCRRSHDALAAIRDEAWTLVAHDGQTWAMPIGLNVLLFFYQKDLLRSLGWSDERIDGLPAAIAAGQFTLEDAALTARAAVAAGVVQPGYGFWQPLVVSRQMRYYYDALGGRVYDPAGDQLVVEPAVLERANALLARLADERVSAPFTFAGESNSWSVRTVWHDAVMHDRVLFWLADSADWTKWVTDYVEHPDGEAYLLSKVGAALLPSAIPGRPGPPSYWWSAFVIMNERASGRRNQAAACDLLAAMTAPSIASVYPAFESEFHVLTDEAVAAATAATAATPEPSRPPPRFTALNHAMIAPVWQSPTMLDERMTVYNLLLSSAVGDVAGGRLSPAEGATVVVERLRVALGPALNIR